MDMEDGTFKELSMLQELLRRYCLLEGLEMTPTQSALICTMPSGVRLTVFSGPRRLQGCLLDRCFGIAEYPWRKYSRVVYLGEHNVDLFVQKLQENIGKLETKT